MGSVWKRLQRVNKRAAKFQFTVSYHQVILETTPRWQPNKLSVVWARRSRRVVSEPLPWEPTMKDPLCGVVIWPVPENKEVAVTLFKDPRTNQLEDKDWTFVLEDVASNGKRRQLATCNINMKKYASVESTHQQLTLNFKTTTKKVVSASLECTLFCVFLREGKATDEDMQSMASLMSTNNNSDIAPLDDFDEEDDYDDSVNQALHEVLDLTAQMDKLTHSLSGSEFASTPMSVPSLTSPRDDPTPVASDGINDFGFPSSGTKTLSGFDKGTTSEESVKTDQTEKVHLNLTPINKEDQPDEQTSTPKWTTPMVNGKESVTGQDLLEWCKKVTAHYPGVRVTNLTTSWRNGLAFCAVINHFRPDLVEMDHLNPHDVRQNCKIAFDAGEILGIPRVIEPADMDVLTVPDKLAVITYLCQLRAHFTGHELEVQQIGKTANESSYMVGRFNTDDDTEVSMQLFGQEIQNLRKKETLVSKSKLLSNSRKSTSTDSSSGAANDGEPGTPSETANFQPPPPHQPTPPAVTRQSSILRLRLPLVSGHDSADRTGDSLSPSSVREVTDKILASSKSIIGKVLSPSKEKVTRREKEKSKSPVSPSHRPVLMTRRQLTDPFGSDEEDEGNSINDKNVKKPGSFLTRSQSAYEKPSDLNNSAAGQDQRGSNEGSGRATPDSEFRQQSLLTRHDELKERARQLFEQARRETASRMRGTTPTGQPLSPVQTPSLAQTPSSQGDEERRAQLRERARKLIAEAKQGVVPGAEAAPTSTPSAEFADPLGASNLGLNHKVPSPSRSPSKENPSQHSSPAKSKESSPVKGSSSLHSFSSLIDRISPERSPQRKGNGKEVGNYIQNELEALEREQKQIDEQAALLEKELRKVMETGNEPQREETLMSQWFTLVNKKNALIRRQMQLNILEKEDDLERRSELLARELRSMIMMEDWQKSEEQKFREALLLDELLLIVNKRDELVHHLDSQEKAIEDDDEIVRDLKRTGLTQRKEKCVIS